MSMIMEGIHNNKENNLHYGHNNLDCNPILSKKKKNYKQMTKSILFPFVLSLPFRYIAVLAHARFERRVVASTHVSSKFYRI